MQFQDHKHSGRNAYPAGDHQSKVSLLNAACACRTTEPFRTIGDQLLEYLESHGAHLILPPKNDRQPYLHAGEMLIWPDTANNHVVVTMPDGSLLAGNPDEVETFVGALLAAVSRLRKS